MPSTYFITKYVDYLSSELPFEGEEINTALVSHTNAHTFVNNIHYLVLICDQSIVDTLESIPIVQIQAVTCIEHTTEILEKYKIKWRLAQLGKCQERSYSHQIIKSNEESIIRFKRTREQTQKKMFVSYP